MMPSPPTHCMSERHHCAMAGRRLSCAAMVRPVLVKPDTDSNSALGMAANGASAPASSPPPAAVAMTSNGTAPTPLHSSQPRAAPTIAPRRPSRRGLRPQASPARPSARVAARVTPNPAQTPGVRRSSAAASARVTAHMAAVTGSMQPSR